MAIAPVAEAGSPQLFDEMDAECSQLAQLPPKYAGTPKHYRQPSLQALNLQHSVKPEPLSKSSDLAPTNIIVPAPPLPQSNPSCKETNNMTQTYSYQRTNVTQTILPELYPAHFIHQLPPEPEYITGTIIPSELRRDSCGAATQEPISDVTMQPGCNEEYSLLSLDAESLVSTTPSLSESLAEVFGTTKIRTLLNIELPRVYRVQEYHLPILASLLDVDLRRLRILLELTQRLTLEQLQQLTQDCCEVFSVQSSSEE
ncbi:GH15242 [Drosophila grimshawi]|uniref:GH15242 n=1 Tax=Drosophila grimshawi TaxID=7222 RepID=B4IX58_DROGR|nr:GH15242 [Drosophila grimshawi]